MRMLRQRTYNVSYWLDGKVIGSKEGVNDNDEELYEYMGLCVMDLGLEHRVHDVFISVQDGDIIEVEDTGFPVGHVIKFAEKCAVEKSTRWAIMDLNIEESYSEPGYDDPKGGYIVLGNWNDASHYDEKLDKFVYDDKVMTKLSNLLEKNDCDVEWDENWYRCDECSGIFRCTQDCYGWTTYGYEFEDYSRICGDCIRENPDDYLNELEGSTSKALTLDIDFLDEEYTKVDCEFENGLYGGQSASPQKIGELLESADVHRYIFEIDSVDQFDTHFSVWVHDSEYTDDLECLLLHGKTNGADPAAMMEKALKDSIAKMDGLQGDGVRYAKLKMDGTADVKLVSQKDFIEGNI